MRRTFATRLVAAVVLAALAALLPAVPAPSAGAAVRVAVPAAVADQVAATGKATFWVVLRDRADLATASRVGDWSARGAAVVDALRATAERSQAGVLAALRAAGAKAEPFWVVNAVRVTGGQAAIDAVTARPEVRELRPARTYELPRPAAGQVQPTVEGVEWGVDRIGADDVWTTFGVRGEGVVVANIDTGVDYRHPALVNQYRGNLGGTFSHDYNWFDPSNVCPSDVPCDNNSHGTHTMGTMVGDDGAGNRIGVAPGARWIAAKGCESSSCSDRALLLSGQWVLAPTDLNGESPRPDLRPNVVNNSWGTGDGSDPFYADTVAAWVASGIFPSFSNGNSGPSCGTVGAPGSYPGSYGAGAFDVANRIASFSSRGPSPVDGSIKPDIAAPGVDVRSSVPDGYASFDGTSMAAPHVSGSVALVWSAAPELVGDVATTRGLLDATAVDVADDQCGGTPEDNNVWGEGRLDALAAVQNAPRGPSGTLRGAVLAAGTGDPVAGALVTATDGDLERSTIVGDDGRFSLVLPAGTWRLAASAFGHEPATAEVKVVEGEVTRVVLRPTALPAHPVTGIVVDGLGEPVAGTVVTLGGTPLPAQVTGVDGRFSFPSVPEGRYRLTVQAGGCWEPRTMRVDVDGPERVRVLTEHVVDAAGYGCDVVPSSYVAATRVLRLTGDDDTRQVTLPFAFPFYGRTVTSAFVGTNGLLTFRSGATQYFNERIPSPAAPNLAVYAFWDDLVVDDQASVRTETIGTAPDRRFVVEWRNVHFYDDASHRVTVEAVLGEDGSVTTQWFDLGADPRERGGSATVGIEDADGRTGLQFSFDQPVLADGRAVRFSPAAG
ncbi:MAG TPA: S8 family serine peptidase [Acidimicrobiales bacterium]